MEVHLAGSRRVSGGAVYGIGFALAVLIASAAALLKCPMSVPRDAQSAGYDRDAILDLRWDHDAKSLMLACDEAIAAHNKRLDGIGALGANGNVEGTLIAFELANTEFDQVTSPLTFLGQVSTDPAIRKAGMGCDEKVSKLWTDVFAREDVYRSINAAVERAGKLDRDVAFLATETIKAFERNGMGLAPAARAEYLAIQKRLVELTTKYSETLNEWKDPSYLTRDELDGLSEDFVKGLKVVNGKYEITLAYPHALPVMEEAKRADVRKRIQEKYEKRGGEANVRRFEEAVYLRGKAAKMLGYASHAAFKTSDRMAGTETRVRDFLEDLRKKLRSKADEEMAEYVALKREETGNQAITTIDPWDSRYYRNIVKKRRYEVDETALQPYFPLQRVMDGMFDIYQTLLGVRFERLPNAKVWHKDVAAYAVRDNASGRVMSHFYVDLFPREGKYGHAAAFGLVPGHVKPDGGYQGHVSAIVANFTQPTADKPSLLRHGEVETLFHEFGHIMHGVLTRARYGSFAGTSVKRDFVESLSQIFENWVWDPAMLSKMSGHWKTGEPIPADLMKKLVASRLANIGTILIRQTQLGLADLTYYSRVPSDARDVKAVETWNQVYRDVNGVEPMKGTYPIASFSHTMNGYDAGYYSYLWSEVFAHDMFSRFKEAGLLSNRVGMELRRKVMEKGGMADPMELLEDFLGREPSNEAFLRNNGIVSSRG